MIDYKIQDLKKIFNQNINTNSEVVFVAGNLANLGLFDGTKQELLEGIISSILDASKNEATIMTQTMSFQLCNTNTPFHRYTWANLGSFGNFLLNLKDSVRSLHPFASYTAYGKNANICDTITPFAYGIASPYDNMLKYDDILMMSVGLKPNITCSLIHHVEFNMHVPYRYIKEFNHPVQINDEIVYKKFYLHVLYKEFIRLKRDENKKIFDYFIARGGKIKEIPIGKNAIYIYNYKDFYNACIEYFLKDIYAWMHKEPEIKPYTS